MDVEAPARAQHIRTILFELSRIANVSLFLGDLGVQMGAITPVFFAFRDREYVLNLIEGATGGRFHPNFDRIGGLKDDLPKGWIAETKAVMKKLRTFCDQIEELLFGNEIFQSRTRGIGVIPRDIALQYGLSGANLRASGVDWDLRRDHPLAVPRGAEREPDLGTKKGVQQELDPERQERDEREDGERTERSPSRLDGLHRGRGPQERQVRASHDPQVDRVEHDHRQHAGEEVRDPKARVE